MEHTDIEYELKDGTIVILSFEAEYEAEDHGIGGYEYWGAKCNDVQWVNVCTDVGDIRAENEEGEDIYDSLSPDEQKAIASYCEEYADEHAPDVE